MGKKERVGGMDGWIRKKENERNLEIKYGGKD